MRFQLIVLLLLFSILCFSQESTIVVRGIVESQKELLYGVNVYCSSSLNGVSTDVNGKFKLTIPKGFQTIIISYLGYETDTIKSVFNKDTVINIRMRTSYLQTEEIIISDKKLDENLSKDVDLIKMDNKTIENLPSFLGDKDPFKSVQLVAGVQSVGEGFNALNVRGGNYDQNLILLDGATVFNPSHLMGFFSVFNSDVINNLTFYKGNMPAKYGGRISSLMDIETKSGDSEKHHLSTSIGLLSTKISSNGPILKNKLTYNASFRRTYLDEVIKPIALKLIDNPSEFFENEYSFYDVNLSLSARLTDKDILKYSYYSGKDIFVLNKPSSNIKTELAWGNIVSSLSWKHIYNSKSYHKLTASYSKYMFKLEALQNNYSLDVNSVITESVLFYDYNKIIENHHLFAGAQFKYNQVLPGDKTIGFNGKVNEFNDNDFLNSAVFSAFVGDRYDILTNLDITLGLRFNYNVFLGPYNYYELDESNRLLDTVYYPNHYSLVGQTVFLSPRFSFNYKINTNSSIKGGYVYNQQDLHVAQISSLTLPADFWIPSTQNIVPQKGTQASIGYFRNFLNNKFETSVQCYYKEQKDIIEHRSSIIGNYYEYNIDDNILIGKGKSWGVEFETKYSLKDFNATFSYTYSKSMRYFPDINNGEKYPSKQDRPHDLTSSISYKLNDKISFYALFVYASGMLMTVPESRYLVQGLVLNSYYQKNGFRMPAYHRLDVAISYTTITKKKHESIFELAVYNVYNRQNPFYVFFEMSGNVYEYELRVKAKQVTLFPILPSVSWKYNF